MTALSPRAACAGADVGRSGARRRFGVAYGDDVECLGVPAPPSGEGLVRTGETGANDGAGDAPEGTGDPLVIRTAPATPGTRSVSSSGATGNASLASFSATTRCSRVRSCHSHLTFTCSALSSGLANDSGSLGTSMPGSTPRSRQTRNDRGDVRMGAEGSPGARFARSFTVTFPSDSRLMDVRTHAYGWGEWKGTVQVGAAAASPDHDAGEAQFITSSFRNRGIVGPGRTRGLSSTEAFEGLPPGGCMYPGLPELIGEPGGIPSLSRRIPAGMVRCASVSYIFRVPRTELDPEMPTAEAP